MSFTGMQSDIETGNRDPDGVSAQGKPLRLIEDFRSTNSERPVSMMDCNQVIAGILFLFG